MAEELHMGSESTTMVADQHVGEDMGKTGDDVPEPEAGLETPMELDMPIGAAAAVVDQRASEKKDDIRVSKGVPCANKSCGFMVTWHATHCCVVCSCTQGKHHGKCCSRVPNELKAPEGGA